MRYFFLSIHDLKSSILCFILFFFIFQNSTKADGAYTKPFDLDSLKEERVKNPELRPHLNFLIARHFHKQTYGYSSNQDSMLHYLKLATDEAKEKGVDSVLARCYMFKGKSLSRAGLFAESNQVIADAKKIFTEMGDSLSVSKMEYLTAYNFMDLGMYDEGIPHLESALRRSESSPDTNFTAGMYLAMGNFMTAMMKFPESRPYTRKAIATFTNAKLIEIGGAYHNLARSYSFSKMYDSSYFYYQKSLETWKEANYSRGEGILYTNLSEFFTQQDKYDRAIDYLLKAETILIEIKDDRRLKSAYLKIADNYLLLNQAQKAKIYIGKAEDLGMNLRTFGFMHELDRLKAKMYEQMGNYKMAFKHQALFLKRSDTLIEQDAEQRVLESDRRLEFLRKTKDLEVEAISIKSLEQEKELLEAKQGQYLIIFGFILVVITLLVFYFNRKKRYKSKIQEVNLLKSQEMNNQLQKEIEFRRKKLSSFALQLIDKNQKLDDVKKDIEKLRESNSDKKFVDGLFNLEKVVDKAINTEQSWEEFKLYFEEVHTDFFSKIKTTHPSVSSRELRLSALLRLNLSTKEIANLLNLPTKTIEVARYRLRKKLELKQEDNLVEYIMSI